MGFLSYSFYIMLLRKGLGGNGASNIIWFSFGIASYLARNHLFRTGQNSRNTAQEETTWRRQDAKPTSVEGNTFLQTMETTTQSGSRLLVLLRCSSKLHPVATCIISLRLDWKEVVFHLHNSCHEGVPITLHIGSSKTSGSALLPRWLSLMSYLFEDIPQASWQEAIP